jgi:imidazolonepropionase-like amidohydrolase
MQEMHAVGVRFLAGSDSTNPGLVPGFALHDELEDLVGEAGFTPLEALRMATLRPAEFLRRDEELGAVETGMLADLVLLRGNPLESIERTREIEMVFAGGECFDRARLDGLLESVRRDFDRLGGSPAGAD